MNLAQHYLAEASIMRGWLVRFGFEQEDAADLVQDVFAEAAGYDQPVNRTWLWTKLRWRRQDWLDHRTPARARLVSFDDDAGPQLCVQLRDPEPAIEAALNKLTSRQRAYMVEQYYYGLSDRESAELHGMNRNNVRRQRTCARAALRRVLGWPDGQAI